METFNCPRCEGEEDTECPFCNGEEEVEAFDRDELERMYNEFLDDCAYWDNLYRTYHYA